MPPYGSEPETNRGRRDVIFAAAVLVLALTTTYVSEPTQQTVALSLRATILRPFIATQERVIEARRRASEVDALTAQLDSLSAVATTMAGLADENRTLRAMLGVAERGGPSFVPATVLRPGTPGSERMFIVDVGRGDGVSVGAPVVAPHGLVGVIQQVQAGTSVGIDWSHPDFRVSAMLGNGSTYGIVETRRGRFQEDDRLILNGTAYTTNVRPGDLVMTSGLGRVFPRGIPVGKIDRLLDTEGSWRKSFWIEPMVEPGSVTHVLVLTEGSDGDVSGVWPADSIVTREEAITRGGQPPTVRPSTGALRPPGS